MKNTHMRLNAHALRHSSGFSLIELMIALALGLLLTLAMATVFLSTKTAFGRQQQLSAMQQNVRIAFEYLTSDARMVGHMGCYTGRASGLTNGLAATNIATNYALGVEGYEYTNATPNSYTLTSSAPSNSTTATEWATNIGAGGVNTIPISTIAADGLTPGSDVLVIRTVSGKPVRLSANTALGSSTLNIENIAGGKCSNGTTDKVSGFCTNSHGVIASCTAARVFSVTAVAAPTLTMSNALVGAEAYTTAGAEVFPMQTVVYYVKKSSNGTTTSLYRRTFDGDYAAGLEQELIEGVETMQLRYGVDTTAPTPDGVVDAYVAANAVGDWTKVVAVRMALLLRANEAVGSDVAVPTSGLVNGVTVTYPTAGSKYDRRVFTTTIAVRNTISYF